MTPLEQKEFAVMVANAVKATQDKEQDFWIDGEKHYNDHIKFCGWIAFFEKWKEDCTSAMRKLFIAGGIMVIGSGIYAAFNL